MFIKQNEVKILENTYLEKIKITIIEKHFDEFSEFSHKDNEYYIFDNLQKFVNEYFSEVYKKIDTLAKAYLWFNSGLLTKLMEYDVLHTKEYLRDFYTKEEDEYLVVNPKILHVLIS